MTPAQLAEIEARALAATEGPWVWRGTTKGWYLCCVKGLRSYVIDCFMNKLRVRDFKRDLMVEFNPFHPDAIFIAHSRADIPALIAEVKRLRALVPDVTHEPITGTPSEWPQHIAYDLEDDAQ